ncbi:hypothetical protein [Streptomyces alboflavus]|uniref:hypothetical protein n=1 Tax=Streptomyces alboflavus TaxID=67267 RepID=UPI0036A6C516
MVVVGAAVGLTVPAAAAGGRPLAAAHTAAPPSDDGRNLFAGLAFGQGEVAEKLSRSHLSDVSEGQAAKANSPGALRYAGHVLDRMEAADPGFFAAFADDLRSGDPRRVQSALSLPAADGTGTGTGKGTYLDVMTNLTIVTQGALIINLQNIAVKPPQDGADSGKGSRLAPLRGIAQAITSDGLGGEKAIAELTRALKDA